MREVRDHWRKCALANSQRISQFHHLNLHGRRIQRSTHTPSIEDFAEAGYSPQNWNQRRLDKGRHPISQSQQVRNKADELQGITQPMIAINNHRSPLQWLSVPKEMIWAPPKCTRRFSQSPFRLKEVSHPPCAFQIAPAHCINPFGLEIDYEPRHSANSDSLLQMRLTPGVVEAVCVSRLSWHYGKWRLRTDNASSFVSATNNQFSASILKAEKPLATSCSTRT